MTSRPGVTQWRPGHGTRWQDLASAARQLDGALRVLVLRLDDPAGWPPELPDDAASADGAAVQALLRHLESPDLVSVAVLAADVQPSCLRLALACDLRVAVDDTHLRWDGLQHGWMSPVGLTGLVDLLGRSRATALVLTADALTAEEARRAGLFHRVCPASGLDVAVDEVVAAVLARPRAETAELKALLNRPHRRAAEWDAAQRLGWNRDGVVTEDELPD